MGDTLNSLLQGAQNVAGDVGTAFTQGPGAALSQVGSQLSSIPSVIGADIQGDLVNPVQSLIGSTTGAPSTPGAQATAAGTGGSQTPIPGVTGSQPPTVAPMSAASLEAASPAVASGLAPTDPVVSAVNSGATPLQGAVPAVAAQATPAAGGNIVSNALSALGKNPVQAGMVGLEGASVLRDLLQGQSSQEKTLKALATQEQGQAQLQQNLANAAQQGQLPQQLQAGLDQQLNQQIAQIQQKYAEMGMSGSMAEASDIQAARVQSIGQAFAMGQSLANQGFTQAQQDFGSAGNYLQQIMALDTAQGTQLGDDIANFASLLANGGNNKGTKKSAQSVTVNF
jgi:hypothetical protein